MPDFGGMRQFNPQVAPMNVVGRPPQLSGGSIRSADGNAVVVPAWNPVVPIGQGPQPGVAQLGQHPQAAQSVPMAGQQRQAAQAQPAYQPQMAGPDEYHKFNVQAMGRDGRTYNAPLQVAFPGGTRVVGVLPPNQPIYQMGGQEETHMFTIRGIGRDNREHLREIEVTFPAGVSQPVVSEMY